MGSERLLCTGPLPSIGWPSEFTTRPRSSGPTGTSRMRLVHFTVSPSVMCSYSPRITAPTESRSRFRARPKVFFGNSSISPCITSERPWTRQMPSVTVTTVPCVRTSADSERFCILLRISSLISDGFSCCIVAPGRFLSPPHLRRGGAKRRGGSAAYHHPPPAADPPSCKEGGAENGTDAATTPRLHRARHIFELGPAPALDHLAAG